MLQHRVASCLTLGLCLWPWACQKPVDAHTQKPLSYVIHVNLEYSYIIALIDSTYANKEMR